MNVELHFNGVFLAKATHATVDEKKRLVVFQTAGPTPTLNHPGQYTLVIGNGKTFGLKNLRLAADNKSVSADLI